MKLLNLFFNCLEDKLTQYQIKSDFKKVELKGLLVNFLFNPLITSKLN